MGMLDNLKRSDIEPCEQCKILVVKEPNTEKNDGLFGDGKTYVVCPGCGSNLLEVKNDE